MNYDDIINKMDKTVGVFENNLAEVRAGRANPAIIKLKLIIMVYQLQYHK